MFQKKIIINNNKGLIVYTKKFFLDTNIYKLKKKKNLLIISFLFSIILIKFYKF